LPRPPRPTMPRLTLSFAPHTRTADAAVIAPRKNRRVFGSATVRLLFAVIVSGKRAGGSHARNMKLQAPTDNLQPRALACSETFCLILRALPFCQGASVQLGIRWRQQARSKRRNRLKPVCRQ